MEKDKWITPDDYHFQDILENGRCVYCGKLADHTTQTGYKVCPNDCESIVEQLVKEVS